jgi:hypothetical protein
MAWWTEFMEWRARRRRFAEEWSFHRHMAARELHAMGVHRKEARKLAAQRLGRRKTHRSEALRLLRADWRSLLETLPWRRWRRSPWLVGSIAGLAGPLLLIANPDRSEVIRPVASILLLATRQAAVRLVPLTPGGAVPVGAARLMLWTWIIAGLTSIAVEPRFRGRWRVWIYGLPTIAGFAAFGAVFWVTALQCTLRTRWPSDLLQGLALNVFAFAFAFAAFAGFRWWRRDLSRRCPICLRLLGMPEIRGAGCGVLVDPEETEAICMRGHGASVESRWGQRFQPEMPEPWRRPAA